MIDVPHATLNQHESAGLPEGQKGPVREMGRTNHCLARGKDPSHYIRTEPTFLGSPPQYTSYIAACEGRMRHASTHLAQLKSPSKGALGKLSWEAGPPLHALKAI